MDYRLQQYNSGRNSGNNIHKNSDNPMLKKSYRGRSCLDSRTRPDLPKVYFLYSNFILLGFPLSTFTFANLTVPRPSCQASTAYVPGGISLMTNSPFSFVIAA